MPHVVPSLPSTFGTQALFSTYYLALVDDYDPVKSGMTAFETAEMNAALALIKKGATTNITKLFAVNSGNWNTAANWYPSGVPGAGAYVCIPEGTVCTYALDAPSTKLFGVRVDGTLKTDVTVDTAMLFDTMVVTPLGTFQDGVRATPVPQGITHEWIIATSNGLIDVAWDTFFQSRGIIWIGTTRIWGAAKTPFLEVASYTGPVNTATSLTLASAPTNWNVGDDIIICSTRAKPYTWNNVWSDAAQTPETERRTLTSSSGASLGWTGGLTYSHAGPQGTLNRTDCKAYVANLTRNIIFRPDDTAAAIHHRGHLMQMHNRRFQGANFEVADLGRTAKHHGLAHMVVFKTGALAANTATDLTLSAYWNGSAISFGPTFKMSFQFNSVGAGNITITGTNAAGGAQTETLAYADGFSDFINCVKYFRTVTEIKYSTAIATNNPKVSLLARSRQLNDLGVRDLYTGTAVYTAVTAYDNVQGRYPLHWHKMGLMGDIYLEPPFLRGCSFHGSPSWLVAQHQTHGDIIDCVGFDAQGAGLVSEDGPETGLWIGNLMAKFIGNGDGTIKKGQDLLERDIAVVGSPFWFSGRMPRTKSNIAIDCLSGFAYNSRHANIGVLVEQFDQPGCVRGKDVTNVSNNVVPLGHFDDNVAIACAIGISVVKAQPAQFHDLRTVLRRFKVWSAVSGCDIGYTRNYSLIDWDVFFGNVTSFGGKSAATGILLFDNASAQSFIRPTIEGFGTAMTITHGHTENTGGPAFDTDPRNGRIILDQTVIDCTTEYVDFNAAIDQQFTAAQLNSAPISLSVTSTSTSVTGTKHDEFGYYDYPFGFDQFDHTRTNLLTYYGHYTDTASGNKYVMTDEWFSSALTGEMQKIKVPVDVTSGVSLTGMTNHGSMNLTNDTAPIFANFSVSMTRNTNKTVDILALASGNTIRFGGYQRPMKTFLVDNEDGTITLIPLTDENYTESCYIWVDDANGNTTRSTMTINVNRVKLSLGRRDLLPA